MDTGEDGHRPCRVATEGHPQRSRQERRRATAGAEKSSRDRGRGGGGPRGSRCAEAARERPRRRCDLPSDRGLRPPCIEPRVRFQIIRNARLENVGKSQSCMVSKVRIIIWKPTVPDRGSAACEMLADLGLLEARGAACDVDGGVGWLGLRLPMNTQSPADRQAARRERGHHESATRVTSSGNGMLDI